MRPLMSTSYKIEIYKPTPEGAARAQSQKGGLGLRLDTSTLSQVAQRAADTSDKKKLPKQTNLYDRVGDESKKRLEAQTQEEMLGFADRGPSAPPVGADDSDTSKKPPRSILKKPNANGQVEPLIQKKGVRFDIGSEDTHL